MHYYDPMFYICSDEMPFVVRLEIALKHEIDGIEYFEESSVPFDTPDIVLPS